MACSDDEFIEKIEECLRERNDEEIVAKRKDTSRSNSWEKRIDAMLNIINAELYAQKNKT